MGMDPFSPTYGNGSIHPLLPLRNPDTSELGNCLIKGFNDGPLWTVPTNFTSDNRTFSLRPFCYYNCHNFLTMYDVTCADRSK
jgi:hypothetical protein